MKNKIFIPLLIILIILIFISYSYNEIFRPAYFSVIGVCQPEKFDGNGYVKAGSTETIINESGESNTEIWISPQLTEKQRKETKKHEICHYYQAEIRFFPSQECFKPIEKYLSELECYVTQKFPDITYERFYNITINDLEP
ncbi:MAG: hypothetical protein AABY22_01590 [Nanoarchaeota archaeon]